MHTSFTEFVDRHPECLERSSFAALETGNEMPLFRLQPWPIWIDAPEFARMEEVSLGVTRLIRSLPQRIFRNDPAELARFYGFDSELMAALAIAKPNGLDAALCRGDYMATATGLQCIELNGGTGLGGWMLPCLAPLYSEVPILNRFLDQTGQRLQATNTLGRMLQHFIEDVARSPDFQGQTEINSGITIAEEDHDVYNAAAQRICNREYAAALHRVDPQLSGTVAFCPYEDFEVFRGRIYLGGQRLHAIFEQRRGPKDKQTATFRSFKAGRLQLYSGPASIFLGHKRTLALLSERGSSDLFSDEEQRLIQAAIPWTRDLVADHTNFAGERVSLPEFAAANRQRLVLKRAVSHAGKDVHLGPACSTAQWERQLAIGLEDGGWLLQEHLDSTPYQLLSSEGRSIPHEVIFGLFVIGDRPAGGFLRVLPMDQSMVINVSHGAESLPFFELTTV